MGKYILKRLVQTVAVILIVAIATFFLTSLVPGDPVLAVAGTDELEQEKYVAIYHELNLDKPVIERFFIWFWGVLHLDFGTSYVYHQGVWELIGSRIGITMYLALLSLVISFPIGVLFGIITAVKRGTKIDAVITLLANICACLPQFWIGICLMYVFGLKLGLLPAFGLKWASQVGLGAHVKALIMPLTCLSLGGIAGITRQTRSSMLEVIRQDFVRTARSKGIREKIVISKHVLRNGLIPVITMLGSRLAHLIGGSMFVENVFTIPGMGMLIMKCVTSHDMPTIQAMVLITATVSCVAYIITDILYVVVDPRISLTSNTQS